VIPWAAQKAVKGLMLKTAKNATEEEKAAFEKEHSFSRMSSLGFGAEGKDL